MKAHHKESLSLILNETQLPFTSFERRIVGNIARYHRKGCPRYKHYIFNPLSRELRRKVTILVGILRLADGLDFSHKSIVQNVEAQVSLENVTVQGLVNLNPILEDYAVNKKKDVFEKYFKKKVVMTWKQIQQLQQVNQQPQIKTPQSSVESGETEQAQPN